MTEWNREESNLYQHAKSELERTGLLLPDADYDGDTGKHVLELIETFARQGHSGGSAEMTLSVFDTLSHYRPLSPLTADPDEWLQIHDGIVDGINEPPLWQSRRRAEAFSFDGGKSYYLVSERTDSGETTMYTSDPNYPSKDQENETNA